MKIWKIAMVITLAIALVVGLSPLASADSDVADEPQAWGKKWPRIVRGEVDEVGDGFFAIQTLEKPIYVTEGTKYFKVLAPQIARAVHRWRMKPSESELERPMPARPKLPFRLPWLNGKPELAITPPQPNEGRVTHPGIRSNLPQLRHLGEETTFEDIEISDKVVVLLVPGKDKLTARVVLIIKPSPWGRIAGTITAVSDDSITIDPVNGGDGVTLTYNGDTMFILKGITAVKADTEQFARAVYNTETELARVVRVWPEAP